MNISLIAIFIICRALVFIPGFSLNTDNESLNSFNEWARRTGYSNEIIQLYLSLKDHGWILNSSQDITAKRIFVLYFDRMTLSIDTLAKGLSIAVNYIARNGHTKVDLVGYSVGGLIARTYVVKMDRGRRVKTLMTIATPHLGTPFANIYRYSRWFKPLGYDFNCPALREMSYPIDNNPFLTNLNRQNHSPKIGYISVICNPRKGLSLSEMLFLIDFKEKFVDFLKHLFLTFLEVAVDCNDMTDGLVPVESQNMGNIENIKRNKTAVKNIELEYTHSEIMRHIDDFIYTLDSKPNVWIELKSRLGVLFGGKTLRLTHDCFFWKKLRIIKVIVNGLEEDAYIGDGFIEIPLSNYKFRNEIELHLQANNYATTLRFICYKIF